MNRFLILAVVAVLTLSLCAQLRAAPGDLLFKLTAPDPQVGARFGSVVANVDGDILVGELTRDLGLGIDARGRAYLFDGQTGKLKQTFNLPEPMRGDLFGASLAGGDGRVFISTLGVPPRAYAFDTQTGQYLHTIRAPSQFHNNFGAAIAYGNGDVLVSAPAYGEPFGPHSIGRADLFDASSGQHLRALPNPEPNVGDALGSGDSLAIFGNRAAVGANLDDFPDDGSVEGEEAGRVWVFDRSTGETVFTLENPNPQKLPPHFFSDAFGASVAANERFIVVAASDEATGGVDDSGAAYVFDSQTGNLLHTLFSPRLEERGYFGRSVAVSDGNHVLLGSSGASVNGLYGMGHAYLFDGLTGNMLLDIANPEPGEVFGFGFSVAVTDERIFVGTLPGEAVYVFEGIPEPTTLTLAGASLAIAYAVRRLHSTTEHGTAAA